MIYKKLSLLLIGIISIALYSCSENPVSIGLGLLKNDYLNVKEKDSYSDSLSQHSSSVKYTVPLTSSTTSLLIGKAANVTGSALAEFYISLADSIKTDLLNGVATVEYANVTMYPNYVYGDSNLTMDFSVHRVSNDWTAAGVDADSIAYLGIDANDLSTNRNFTDTVVTFDLNKSYMLDILKYASDSTLGRDYGLYLKPSGSSRKVVGFNAISTSSSTYTTIKIVLVKSGVYSDTLAFVPWKEASIVSGTMPSVSSEDMVVQSGLVVNSKLVFDVSAIPKNALINYANLTLTVDTVATVVGSSYNNYLTIKLLTDSTARAYDSTQTITLSRSGNTFQGNIATYVQNWVDKSVNEGLLIQTYAQIDGLELFALKASNAANRTLRPRIQITYTERK